MTKRVVLIGHPVAHSLSGAMQQAAFDHLGIDARYELWDRSPVELAEAIAELRTEDYLGANITIPHKERVVPHTDRQTDEAHVTGAVNTLTKEGKKLGRAQHGRRGLQDRPGQAGREAEDAPQRRGAGRGWRSRAVVYGLIREGFQRVVVFNRHLHRAEGMVKHFARSSSHMDLRAMPWHESIIEAELSKAKVLVNATSIGLTTDESPIPAEILTPDLLVLDLINSTTRLLRDAQSAGCVTADGELMLLHQGAASFALWTGQAAPLDVMHAALAEARARGITSTEGEPGSTAVDAVSPEPAGA